MYNIIIAAWNDLSFEWDPAKAEINLSKHGVSLEETKSEASYYWRLRNGS